ncbi:MAG: hypothetical protein V4722_09150 [Bacteroidota bacterium]
MQQQPVATGNQLSPGSATQTWCNHKMEQGIVHPVRVPEQAWL